MDSAFDQKEQIDIRDMRAVAEASGIMVFEDYSFTDENGYTRNELAVVLFAGSKNGKFQEPGGLIDRHEFHSSQYEPNPLLSAALKAAIRETYEETCGLLKFEEHLM